MSATDRLRLTVNLDEAETEAIRRIAQRRGASEAFIARQLIRRGLGLPSVLDGLDLLPNAEGAQER